MAKIVPGQRYADLGEYDEFDDYKDMFSFIKNIGDTYTKVKTERENSDIGSLQYIYKAMDDVNTMAGIDGLQNAASELIGDGNYIYDNELGNILSSQISAGLQNKKGIIQERNNRLSSGASTLMTSKNIFGVPAHELTENNIIDSYAQGIAAQGEGGGYINGIINRQIELNTVEQDINDLIGYDRNGKLNTRIPSMNISYVDDNNKKQDIPLIEYRRRILSQKEKLKTILYVNAQDGIISPEIASVILNLTGEEGFDFKTLFKPEQEAQIERASKGLKDAKNNYMKVLDDISMLLRNTENGQVNLDDAAINNFQLVTELPGFSGANPSAYTGDANQDKEQFIQDLSLGNITKSELLVLQNKLKEGLAAQMEGYRQTLKAWNAEEVYGGTPVIKNQEDVRKIDFSNYLKKDADVKVEENNKIEDGKNVGEKQKKVKSKKVEIIPPSTLSSKIDLNLAKDTPLPSYMLKPVNYNELTNSDKEKVFKKVAGKPELKDRNIVEYFNNLSLEQQSKILNVNLKKEPYSYYKTKQLNKKAKLDKILNKK